VAREIIGRGLAWRGPGDGRIEIDDIVRSQKFDNTVFARRWDLHCATDPLTPSFLDYGLPDVIGVARSSGNLTSLFELRAGLFRYKKVFVLEPLSYKEDEARRWTEEEREKILSGIIGIYKEYGCPSIRVPPLPREARRDYVLERIAG